MAASYSPVQTAFDAAIREFKANLNNDKIYSKLMAVTSIDDVYDLTDAFQAEQSRKGHLRHLAKIQPYLNRLNDYTGAIDTFVQVKPEILSLILGPIKLLLQWSNVMMRSFDAIVNTTADIGAVLPEFQEVVGMFSHNDRIQDVLILFFKDILDFYSISLKFFTMPRWKYFFESVWPRKREHINLIKTHIERHMLLMRNEVRLEHIREEHDARLKSLEHFKNTERAHRLQEFHAIKTDISPRSYDDRLNWYHGRVCEGTGTWLLKDELFKQWLDTVDGTAKVLWLQGIPGAGKTFLSGTVVDKTRAVGHTAFAFLSHTFSSTTSALTVFHSLIFQLASKNDSFQDVLCQAAREHLKSDMTVAAEILKSLLDCAGPAFLIVDGVDEIGEIERSILLKRLMELSRDCNETRILISSRQEDDISKLLRDNAESIRVDHRNAGSIQVFVSTCAKEIFQSRDFPPDIQHELGHLLVPLASKAKGMFLYAKVVLSSIEMLDDVAEICEELSVLPEDLDDAYSRVLSRINLQRSPIKDKARRLLSWVGCSPTPLTVRELGQALTIRPGNYEVEKRMFISPNIGKLCGPIVEAADEYVQFVHFTVKEYLFSPRIDGFINPVNATLDLLLSCITYLCQSQYDLEDLDDEGGTTSLALSGAYTLHYHATNYWLELLQNYLRSSKSQPPPKELVDHFLTLENERSNPRFTANTDNSTQPPYLQPFKKSHPEIYGFLCNVICFQQKCLRSEYHINHENMWSHFDPLCISRYSKKIYTELKKKLCDSRRHSQQCHCGLIERHYGKRPFKCGFLNCSFQRHGFETKEQQKRHEKHHSRPWKCDVAGCEYENVGFLSGRMRDQHLGKAHRDEASLEKVPQGVQGQLKFEELDPLLFDLIKEDKVETVRRPLPSVKLAYNNYNTESLKHALGLYGSGSMYMLLESSHVPVSGVFDSAVIGHNIQLLVLLASSPTNFRIGYINPKYFMRSIILCLRSGSLEILGLCEKLTSAFLLNLRHESQKELQERCLDEYVIKATSGIATREKCLVSLWETMGLPHLCKKHVLSKALQSVAKTTCSIQLGKVLLQYGAEVNSTRRTFSPALNCAARKSSGENAEFTKFLLFAGADPERECSWSKKRPSEERGAKEIFRWLGISWDKLVDQAKEHRRGLNS